MTNAIPQQDQSTLDNLNPDQPSMVLESFRLKSFGDKCKILVDGERLAKAGFYYFGYSRAKCFSCGGGLQNWDPRDDPFVEHAKWFPNCQFLIETQGAEWIRNIKSRFPFVQSSRPKKKSRLCCKIFGLRKLQKVERDAIEFSTDQGNPTSDINLPASPSRGDEDYVFPLVDSNVVPIRRTVSEISLNSFTRFPYNDDFDPRDETMSTLAARLSTFTDWVSVALDTKKKFAEAGFYRIPNAASPDLVCCYKCGGGLCQWNQSDDPCECHVRFFGSCPHVVQTKGEDYINTILDKYGPPDVEDGNSGT